MRARLFWSVVLLALAAAGYALYSGRVQVPDRWNPWAPLDVEQPLNWLTRYKLSRLSGDRALCLSVLETSDMR